jgi:hypothetical protein
MIGAAYGSIPTVSIDRVHFNMVIIGVLSVIVLFDLFTRSYVTGNLESIAFDISVIGATYSITETIQGGFASGTSAILTAIWSERVVVGVLVFFAIALINAGATREHERMMTRLFERLRHSLLDYDESADTFLIEDTFKDMSKQYFIVSLLPHKRGKLQRREDLVELINRYLPDDIFLTIDDFLLPARFRWTVMVSLFLFGTAALLVPAATLT